MRSRFTYFASFKRQPDAFVSIWAVIFQKTLFYSSVCAVLGNYYHYCIVIEETAIHGIYAGMMSFDGTFQTARKQQQVMHLDDESCDAEYTRFA